MNRISSILLFLAIAYSGFSQQHYSCCFVHQINIKDTTLNYISLKQEFDTKGNLLHEIYTGYKENGTYGMQDREYFYRYNDGKLVEKYFVTVCDIDNGIDSNQVLYIYKEGRLAKEITRYTELPVKSGVGDVIEYPDDYEPRKWFLQGEKNIKYDSRGFKSEEYMIGSNAPEQNRYTFMYDDLSKLICYKSYHDNTLIWTETYSYGVNRNTMTRVWEKEDDDYKDGEVASWANPWVWKFVYDLDDKGNVIQESTYYIDNKEKKEVFHSFKTYKYDVRGRLEVYTGYGENRMKEIIHKYEYCN